MPDYILIIKGGKGVDMKDLRSDARAMFLQTWRGWLRQLKKSQALIYGSPVLPEGRIFYSSGRVETVPENYDMSGDMVTGFCIIRAHDERMARSIAETCILLEDDFTSCEIRQVKKLDYKEWQLP